MSNVRPYMETATQINGWWRLWIVSSLVWLLAISGIAYRTWPTEDFASHHPAFYYQLAAKQRALLETEGTNPVGDAVQMPNGYILHFRQGVQSSDQESVAHAYNTITFKAQSEARLGHLESYAVLALIPSVLVALLGIGVAWIRRGFKAGSNEA